jgi:hypothetical protein
MAKFEAVWSPEVIAECARRHAAGESLRALAVETGIPRSTLGRRIKEHHLAADKARRDQDAARQRRKTRAAQTAAPSDPDYVREMRAAQARPERRGGRNPKGGRLLNWGRSDEADWLDENDAARRAAAAYVASGAEDKVYSHNGRALLTTSRANAIEKGWPQFESEEVARAALEALATPATPTLAALFEAADRLET